MKNPAGKRIAGALKHQTRRHFPHILDEIKGLADGAGFSFDYIWAMTLKAELATVQEEMPGCSTLFYRYQDKIWLFHNEDGHAADNERMFVIQVALPSGVRFIALAYPGIIAGNGPSLNDQGLIQTTNYIGSTRSDIGIPKYVLGRATLEARTLKEAIDIATPSPRSFPYHHNLASFADKKYFSVETTPNQYQVTEPDGIYNHTNHLILESTRDYPYEDQAYKNSSSISRSQVFQEKLP